VGRHSCRRSSPNARLGGFGLPTMPGELANWVSPCSPHLQQTAFDDAAASVVLSEVSQAERALDGIKPTHEQP